MHDSVSSPIAKRVYNLGLDEFFAWFSQEPRNGFKARLYLNCFSSVTVQTKFGGSVVSLAPDELQSNSCCRSLYAKATQR